MPLPAGKVGRRFTLSAIDLTPPTPLMPWQSATAAYLKQRPLSLDDLDSAAADEPYETTQSLPG